METESQVIIEELPEAEPPKPEPAERRASNLPLILTIVALLVWFGFQTAQLVTERSQLSSMKGNLEGAMKESVKARAQLELFITKTAELANQGNASAKTVVEELQKRGIPIGAAASK